MNAVAPSLRVVSLQAQNIMRLTAVEIDWDPAQSTLTVGGRNGAGKSSVLNAVAMALGGKDLCPEEPIRRGEASGFVEVRLGELTVRREFSREKIHDDGCATRPTPESIQSGNRATCDCEATWGETKSKLIVRNADGVSLGTPQAVLNKLIGTMTFDPLSFAALGSEGANGERRQADILRRIVGLDFADVDERRKAAAERRAHWNREHKAAEAVLASMKLNEGIPAEEIPMSDISNEMLKAEEYRRLAQDADRAVDSASHIVGERRTTVGSIGAKIEEVEKQLQSLREQLTAEDVRLADAERELDAREVTAQAAHAVVPDVAVIRKRLEDAEETNARVRANKTYKAQADRVIELKAKAEFEDGYIKAADQEKEDALKAAKFPVEGLGLSDAGVTFGGLPFSQASTAEQIRTSVAIGFALNPGLRLLLVRNGNALDEDSLRVVAAQAEAAGGQILMEYVTKDAGDVSVMIEDGHVV